MTYFDRLLEQASPRAQQIARAIAAGSTPTSYSVAIKYLEMATVRARIEKSASNATQWWHKEA